jgi:hypothetical protein
LQCIIQRVVTLNKKARLAPGFSILEKEAKISSPA